MDYKLIGGVVSLAIGCIGIGYGYAQHKKLTSLTSKLDKAIDEISSKTDVEVSQAIIDKAVNKAVIHEVEYQVSRACKEIVGTVRSDMEKRIDEAVKAEKDELASRVKATIEKKVANINIDSLKREVVEKAKVEAANRLDSAMDDILNDFKGNLAQVRRIYESIAESFPKTNNEMKIKLT